MESPTHVGNTHGVLRRGSAPAVHPHACGEYHGTIEPVGISYGSSPRVWGIPFQHALAQIVDRFIPTRVGNTRRSSSGRAAAPVHPHACGEYGMQREDGLGALGSSPRVWGIPKELREVMDRVRFIPTRVGNTSCRHGVKDAWPVHPHACGEYFATASRVLGSSGSSPRVWGIQTEPDPGGPPPRFIPTRVGNTRRPAMYRAQTTVHPHACGEYISWVSLRMSTSGSSPRVWGIPIGDAVHQMQGRFIPTRVGNTPRQAEPCPPIPVHPHACGEYRPASDSARYKAGSSPRVWGIRRRERQRVPGQRFIPTRVGNTSDHAFCFCRQPVHPHACGEYMWCISWPSWPVGSSPRVWGIRGHVPDRRGRPRFIPTRVGNTGFTATLAAFQAVHPHACGEYFPAYALGRYPDGSSPRVWGILFRKMQEITDCWQSSSVLPSHACCKPAPMTIKRGRSFVKRLLPLVKNCPAGQSRSLDVTCPDRRNARLRS